MRENRLYGSEGGVAERSFLPLGNSIFAQIQLGLCRRYHGSGLGFAILAPMATSFCHFVA